MTTQIPLILVPGLGSDAAVWSRTIRALEGQVSCHVADTLSDASLPGMARRLLAAAPARFALAGVSMGGMVAMEVMRQAPDRITHLALVDTNARADPWSVRAYRLLAAAVALSSPDFRKLTGRGIDRLVHGSAPAEVRTALAEMGARVGARAFARQCVALVRRRDLRRGLGRIACPTLVLCGAEDALTPLALSEEIHRLIPGSTLEVISDCGHLPPIEKPDATAEALRRLLARPN